MKGFSFYTGNTPNIDILEIYNVVKYGLVSLPSWLGKGECPTYVVAEYWLKRWISWIYVWTMVTQWKTFSLYSLNPTRRDLMVHCCYLSHPVYKLISTWLYGWMKISAFSYLLCQVGLLLYRQIVVNLAQDSFYSQKSPLSTRHVVSHVSCPAVIGHIRKNAVVVL